MAVFCLGAPLLQTRRAAFTLHCVLQLLLFPTTDRSSQIFTHLFELLFVMRAHKHVKPCPKESTVNINAWPWKTCCFGGNSLEAEQYHPCSLEYLQVCEKLHLFDFILFFFNNYRIFLASRQVSIWYRKQSQLTQKFFHPLQLTINN